MIPDDQCAKNSSILFKNLLYLNLLCWLPLLFLNGCHAGHKIAVKQDKQLVGEYTKDWLKYRVYELPQGPGDPHDASRSRNLILSIQIINTRDNASPLRRLCSDLEQYDTYYEYLLNRCKDDICLQTGSGLSYPVYYAFENNYNAFPFETINVGYRYPGRKRPKAMQVVFNDRIFSHDTLTINLTHL